MKQGLESVSVAVAIRFGNANNDLIDGVRALNLNNAATNANWNIGASVFIYLCWFIN